MAELAYAHDSKSCVLTDLWVQLPPRAQLNPFRGFDFHHFLCYNLASSLTSRRRSLYQVKHEILGKTDGNFRLSKVEPTVFLKNVKANLQRRGIAKIFIPHCNLGNQVARLGDGNEFAFTPWLMRTAIGFDGAMVIEPNVAVGILNADCPVITLFDRTKGQLILLHGGLKCLWPEKPSKPTIIDSAFRNFKLNPRKLEAFIGFGAGPCCYGVDHLPEQYKRLLPFQYKTIKGPRTGQNSINLFEMAEAQLIDHGVKAESIMIHSECTACAGREDDNPKYHSNIYEGETGGRNLTFAWFEAV